jgi:phosphohistidine phosphatase
MDRLILFRHGKAEPDSYSGDDFDRALAPRGLAESAATGEALARAGFIPQVALVSPALRTRETWAAASAHFPQAEADFDNDLYNASSAEIRMAADEAGAGAGAVMVVGHNPGMGELSLRLMVEGGAPSDLIARARSFPTGGAAVFGIDSDGRATFEGLYFPDRQS